MLFIFLTAHFNNNRLDKILLGKLIQYKARLNLEPQNCVVKICSHIYRIEWINLIDNKINTNLYWIKLFTYSADIYLNICIFSPSATNITAFEMHFEKKHPDCICFNSHIYIINNWQNIYIICILISSCWSFINRGYGLHPHLMTLTLSVLLTGATPTTQPSSLL